jgi:hypothetical protein
VKATYKQLDRLQRSEIEHRAALYQWTHPENLRWLESQREASLRSYCLRIEERLRLAEAELAKRQRVADVADEPELQVADAPPQVDEPLVIRRQGGRPHAK